MLEQALHLRRAVHVFAAEDDFAVDVREGLATDRALVGSGHRLGACRAQVLLDVGNLRDDFAALLDADGVAEMEVQSGDFVEVVEGGALDGGAREAHGCKVSHGRDRTGAADLEFYGEKRRVGALGLELVGDGPARALARGAEFALHGEVVELYDHAVDFEGEAVAARADVFGNLHDFVDRVRFPEVIRVEPELFQHLQVLFVRLVVALRNVIGEETHRARLAFGDALELERTRDGIARVLENLLAFENELLVKAFKGFALHVHFAAHLESALGDFARVDFQFLRVKRFGYVRNRERVQGHVVSLHAVAAGGRLFQAPVLVHDGEGYTINFTFADPFFRHVIPALSRNLGNSVFRCFYEFRHFFGAVNVCDAEHRHGMRDLRKVVREVAAHALG